MRHRLKLALVVFLGAMAGSAGCGDHRQMTGAAGQGGGGAAGLGGGGQAGGSGGASGSGGTGTGTCVPTAGGPVGAGGDAPGSGGGMSPDQIHDALINAPTTGGISVTREPLPPAFAYPMCQ